MEASATPPILLTPIGKERWMVTSSWTAHGVTIPSGFRTDLASIPWWAGWLLKRNDIAWIVAGVIHDYAYRTKTETRLEADRKLRQVAKLEGVPSFHYNVVYIAVRLFGKSAWQR